MVRVRGLWLAALSAAVCLQLVAGCASGGGARKQCPSDAWVGKCVLRNVMKVEERELPMPYVSYQAVYAAEKNVEYPHFTPADVPLRFGAPARFEYQLVDHLKQQAVVPCRASAAPDTCLPQDLRADVVPFDADNARVAMAPRTTGCAAIDAASEQERIAKAHGEASPIPQRFTFEADSSTLAPEATEAARAVAKLLTEDESIECVGLVGQNSPGEAIALAEARARAVKSLLVSLGVDGKRLLTLSATARVMGPAKTQTIEPETRRVSLSVLLKTESKPAP